MQVLTVLPGTAALKGGREEEEIEEKDKRGREEEDRDMKVEN